MKKAGNKRAGTAIATVLVISVMIIATLVAFCASALARPAQRSVESATVGEGRRAYTFLITGRDRVADLADVIMLAVFDTDAHKIRIVQIPRDTYFNYTDRDYKKINGALSACGGAAGFSCRVGEALGVPVDFYVSIDLDAFVEIVDLIGGVEINVPRDMEYTDPYQNLTVRLSKGRQTLDGERAMQFVRFRSGYIRGDISRMDAQKIFVAALAKKLSETKNPVTLCNIFKTFSGRAKTNLSEKDYLYFAYHFLQCEREDISFVTAPGEDVQSEASGAWYYILSRDAMTELLQKELGFVSDFDKRSKFVDKSVKSFYDIYNKYCSYRMYRADELIEGGIDLK